MLDKQWLDKIEIAYQVYVKIHGGQKEVDQFVEWLYRQYGIVRENKN